jgi:Peptidase_C39 like family
MSRKVLPGPYVKQDTQAEFPLANCNVSSLYMAMLASGKGEIPGVNNDVAGAPKLTPVDFLTRLGDSSTAVEAMRSISPWFFAEGKPTVRPPEAPLMLDWIASAAWGGTPSKYSEEITAETIRTQIDAGRAVVLRTLFTTSGHIVTAVGYEDDDATEKILSIVVRDPWGNPVDYEGDKNGNEVPIPLDFFLAKVRIPGSPLKAGHLIS